MDVTELGQAIDRAVGIHYSGVLNDMFDYNPSLLFKFRRVKPMPMPSYWPPQWPTESITRDYTLIVHVPRNLLDPQYQPAIVRQVSEFVNQIPFRNEPSTLHLQIWEKNDVLRDER